MKKNTELDKKNVTNCVLFFNFMFFWFNFLQITFFELLSNDAAF